MRLLNTTTFELVSNSPSVFSQEGYAILSHRWLGSEITFEQLGRHVNALQAAGTTPLESPQQDKIRGACQTARAKGIKWMWIDTCCIDKSSAAELSESLNSMFRWYRDAKLCITYLSDVIRKGAGAEDFINEAGHPSVWFSRGWTLQELLAPRHLEFFDKNWDPMGDRAELAEHIEKITRIQSIYLKDGTKEDFRSACTATKFSWIANRQTEREEDMAYSMLGLFGVTMDPRYGEGWGAFRRLQQELLSSSSDESLFAWKMVQADAGLQLLSGASTQQQEDLGENEWGLLAARPEWFKDCDQMTIKCPRSRKQYIERHEGGFFMQPKGVKISVGANLGLRHETGRASMAAFIILFYATFGMLLCMHLAYDSASFKSDFRYTLNCWDRDEAGGVETAESHGIFGHSITAMAVGTIALEPRMLEQGKSNSFVYPNYSELLLERLTQKQ
ncbi:hypothetical protein J7T55_014136 [Diaporthe amygdali]|uniref:uncharacterized protein n=1 Tax=Phomopsis amygdali TaxID=1214568 RepID=UPI0022FE75E1|nr:uncharacterized protein J7T55_014136 [Diaporthe amygdali]KAJ0109574.1 hypothetical protein J7T55_014136 [Diaporthe amygdali]